MYRNGLPAEDVAECGKRSYGKREIHTIVFDTEKGRKLLRVEKIHKIFLYCLIEEHQTV